MICVTGGCGFLGSEVVSQLVQQGYDVKVLDNLSKESSKLPHKRDFLFKKIDLRDAESTNREFKDAEYCIHLSALIGGIGYFHKIPADILSQNNLMYSSVFDACVKNNVKKMVYISSSMVFESTKSFPSKESDLSSTPPPLSAYGFSKLIGEQYCKAYNDQFGLNYAICRPFNAYGKNEKATEEVGYAHVIPDLIKKMNDGQYPLRMLGDGEQIRCFTHVSDIARGIILAMKKGKNDDFNLSSSEDIKMIDLAKKLWSMTGQKRPFKVKFEKGFQYDIRRRIPDVTKARQVLGFSAKVRLDDGLEEML